MCDCYVEPCKSCGIMIPMHLGDYKTDRDEIMVICEKCLSGVWFTLIDFKKFNRVLWKSVKDECVDDDEFEVMVIALTENAWERRDSNYPNVGTPIMLENLIKD